MYAVLLKNKGARLHVASPAATVSSMRWTTMLAGLFAVACSTEVVAPPSMSNGGAGGDGSGGAGGTAPTVQVVFVDANGSAVDSIRYGDAFAVTVSGLPPATPVRLDSALPGYAGWATFLVDDDGAIDTREDAPVDGTYASVSAEGLLWSMQLVTPLAPDTLDVAITVTIDDETAANATLHRRWLSDGVDDELVNDNGLSGRLFQPSGATEPLPALIVVGGSEGGIGSAEFRASWLAGYGYAALALAYFGAPGLPDDLDEIPLEYFETALDYLAGRPDVDADRIGVVGGSRGGELALMLGTRFPQIDAVVAEVPSGLRWGAVRTPSRSGWSWQGAPLPYMSDDTGGMWAPEALPGGGTGYRSTPMFEVAMTDSAPATIAAATIPVEQGDAAYLLLAGDDDGVWPSCALAQVAMDRLIAAGHDQSHGDELFCFSGAGHHVATPGWPTTDSYAADAFGTTLVFGGTPEGVAHAQREGLERIKAFLATHL